MVVGRGLLVARQGRLRAPGTIGGRSDADVGRAAAYHGKTGRAGARPEPARPGARVRPRAAARAPRSPWRRKRSSRGNHAPAMRARGGPRPGHGWCLRADQPQATWPALAVPAHQHRLAPHGTGLCQSGAPPSGDTGARGVAGLAPASWPSGRLTLDHSVQLSPTPWLRQRRGRVSSNQRPQPGPRAWMEMSSSGGRCRHP